MRKGKIMILAVLVMGIILGMVPMNADAGAPTGRFSVGAQSAFPVFGLSGKYFFNDKFGGQLILGAFGDLRIYGGRVLYKIREEENYDLYGALLVGQWSYNYEEVYWDPDWWGWRTRTGTESVLGFSLDGGIEYFFPGLPELGFSAEIGIASVGLREYNWSTVVFGVGIHYYF